MTGGEFVLSLDFELLWGVRDHATKDSYGQNILGGRQAIPGMLDSFAKHGIAATWATVGAAFCATREELLSALPPDDMRPQYTQAGLSNYQYLDEIGTDEASDPYYFGASLVDLIASCPDQEIATHTMSHFYCLEDGASVASFEADIDAALHIAATRNIEIKSIVFPRNQFALPHLDVIKTRGIKRYRGTETAWAYRSVAGAGQTLPRRFLRLLDAHTGVLGAHLYKPGDENVPASQFLRPCAGRLQPFHALHLGRIERAMTQAAQTGKGFHLWWHPHNFGLNTADNQAGLDRIFACFQRLQGEYGMVSRSMADSGVQAA